MSEKPFKPIKKWDMVATYALGAVAQLLTIVMWFLPTLKAEYFSSSYFFGYVTDMEITLFSFDERLPFVTNVINVALLALSVVSLILMVMPLLKKTVMKPHNMLFPTIVNGVYFALYLVRYFNAISTYPLYDISNTVISYCYLFGLVGAFAVSLSIVISNPKLKKQLALETNE